MDLNKLLPLPAELNNIILYKYKGLSHPTALLIKNFKFSKKYGLDREISLEPYIKNKNGGKIFIPSSPYKLPFSLNF